MRAICAILLACACSSGRAAPPAISEGGEAGERNERGGAGGEAGGEAGGGAAGEDDQAAAPELIDAWPQEASAGDAVLFYGTSLAAVGSVQLNEVRITPAYVEADKLMIILPIDMPNGPLEVRLHRGPRSFLQGIGVNVVPRLNTFPMSPRTPVVPKPYAAVDFPPVSDEWRSECKLGNEDATRYFLMADATVGDEQQFSGKAVYFDNFDSPVTGSHSRSTGLVHLSIESLLYVGVFSRTEKPYLLRMVLFPKAGSQLVLVGCSQTLADLADALCPLPGGLIDLSDTPKDCGQ